MKYAVIRSCSMATAALALVVGAGISITTAQPTPSQGVSTAASSETFSHAIEDGGTGPYKALLASDATLPTHTIFRPKDLSVFGEEQKLPIVAWGNGGCANSAQPVVNYLSEIASHGFLVIAIGPTQPTEPSGRRGGAPGGGTRSSQLLDAVEWATVQNAHPSSIYFKKIDTSKIAVMGTSCGGLQALEVSPDPRITTTIVANSGILNAGPGRASTTTAAGRTGAATAPARGGMPGMPPLTKDHLAKLHAPVLYILGGSTDAATANGSDDFRRIEKIPAYFASIDVGHGGTFARPHGGEFAPVTVAWLQWHLKGDAEAAKMFTGEPSGLAKVAGWKVEKKNIP